MYNVYVKLTTDNTAAAGINYKELHDCKWDPMTLKKQDIVYAGI